jgi:aldose 1-epimerase
MKIEKREFGKLPTGETVYIFRIWTSESGYFEVTNFGATWVSAVVPDKAGKCTDVLLGYNHLDGYIGDTAYMGSTVGRFANRIANAAFVLNGKTYLLEKNDGNNSNHSGKSGYNKRNFDYEIFENKITFSLISPDGDGGFPGNLKVKIHYIFHTNQSVTIMYEAVSDADTFVNLTNHAYFNLSVENKINHHKLFIPSTQVLRTTDEFIPTGEIVNVSETVLDFSNEKSVMQTLSSNDPWIRNNRGLNHCYVLCENTEKMQLAAKLTDPISGRILKVSTAQPAVIVYSAGFLKSYFAGKNGSKYKPNEGICLETQNFPDFPNHPEFGNHILKAYNLYKYSTEYSFECI